MRRLLVVFALLCCNVAASPLPATRGDDAYAYPVSLPLEYRATNYNSHCVWCCLQTMARHLNVTPLVDILKEVDQDPAVAKNGATWFTQVTALLKKKQIAHYSQDQNNYNTTEIQKALKRGIGVMVSLNNRNAEYTHAVVLVGYWRDWVSYYDPDAPEKIWDVTRKEFDRRWNGQALFLDYLPQARPRLPSEQPRLLLANSKVKG